MCLWTKITNQERSLARVSVCVLQVPCSMPAAASRAHSHRPLCTTGLHRNRCGWHWEGIRKVWAQRAMTQVWRCYFIRRRKSSLHCVWVPSWTTMCENNLLQTRGIKAGSGSTQQRWACGQRCHVSSHLLSTVFASLRVGADVTHHVYTPSVSSTNTYWYMSPAWTAGGPCFPLISQSCASIWSDRKPWIWGEQPGEVFGCSKQLQWLDFMCPHGPWNVHRFVLLKQLLITSGDSSGWGSVLIQVAPAVSHITDLWQKWAGLYGQNRLKQLLTATSQLYYLHKFLNFYLYFSQMDFKWDVSL